MLLCYQEVKMEIKHWKIGDFAKKLNKHNNTVDGWFKELEDRKIHYVNRIDSEKVYDEFDFEIAQYIIEKRNDKWSLNGIYDNLPHYFNLRPFPADFEETTAVDITDMERIKSILKSELLDAFKQAVADQSAQQVQSFQQLLPSKEQIRMERFNEMLAERRVIRQLEDEALSMWSEKPEEERMKRVGWFRKEEDKEKQDQFIKNFIDEWFEERMKIEFGIKNKENND